MLNARRIECFRTTPNERWILAGNISGQILVIDTELFEIAREYQGHSGVVHAVAVHPRLPFAASIGTDHTIALWQLDQEIGELVPLSSTSVRDVICVNDPYPVAPVVSHSVALAFHDEKHRIVTRSGNGGILDLAFDEEGDLQFRSCVRLHDDWDVQMMRYAVGSDAILSAGRDGFVVLSENGIELCRWKPCGDKVCHWIEHVGGSDYLIASDAGTVARLDISGNRPFIVGERFAHDDMEFVTYNRVSERAFATSFDRWVYEIDPSTCQSLGQRYSPGYKCIWAETLRNSPSTLIVHSRNGGLYKADVDTGETIDVIQECPPTLWSVIVLPNGNLVGAGEGADICCANFERVDPVARLALYTSFSLATPMSSEAYTKRLVSDAASDRLFLGRTDGVLWEATLSGLDESSSYREVFDAGSAIRDIAIDPGGKDIFLVTEQGKAFRLDAGSFDLLAEFDGIGSPFRLPLWALAYNPDRRILAVADREASVHILRSDDLALIRGFPSNRVKRMKWLDADILLYGDRDHVWSFNAARESIDRLTSEGLENTIEDFIWDDGGRYLLAISYQCVIGLYDLATGRLLDQVRDRMDYSKGLAWLPDFGSAYPWDFVTWGRSGTMQQYRIHEERIVSIGPSGSMALGISEP